MLAIALINLVDKVEGTLEVLSVVALCGAMSLGCSCTLPGGWRLRLQDVCRCLPGMAPYKVHVLRVRECGVFLKERYEVRSVYTVGTGAFKLIDGFPSFRITNKMSERCCDKAHVCHVVAGQVPHGYLLSRPSGPLWQRVSRNSLRRHTRMWPESCCLFILHQWEK
jgi:hypothetical protein